VHKLTRIFILIKKKIITKLIKICWCIIQSKNQEFEILYRLIENRDFKIFLIKIILFLTYFKKINEILIGVFDKEKKNS